MSETDKKDTPGGLKSMAGIMIKKRAGSGQSAGTNAPPQRKDVRKRWMMAGGALVVLALFASSMMKENKPSPSNTAANKAAEKLVAVTPAGIEQKGWQASAQVEIQDLRNQLKDQKQAQEAMKKEMETLRGLKTASPAPALPAGVVAPPQEGQPITATSKNDPVPPPLPPVKAGEKLNKTGGTNLGGKEEYIPEAAAAPKGNQLIFKAPPLTSPTASEENSVSSVNEQGEVVRGKVSYKKNAFAGFLPPGAYAPIVLLHGLEAGTATSNQSNPQPVVLRIQDFATLPGSAKYDLKSCFSVAAGYGELSAERVYIRLAQLSCIDKKDRLVLATDIAGYVVDSDGKLGMRGVVLDRQGSRLAKAMLAGFAQGLGQALSGAQSTVVSSALGAATSISGNDALKASGLNGASQAASQLAQFYLKEAQALFPVIAVDAGRTGHLVFTKGASLQWNDQGAKFSKEVKPE